MALNADFAATSAAYRTQVATDAFAITAGSAFSGYSPARSYCRAIYVGGAGDVILTTLEGRSVTFTAVPAGTVIPCGATAVSGSSTATSMVGLL